jgi:hypothetical protein
MQARKVRRRQAGRQIKAGRQEGKCMLGKARTCRVKQAGMEMQGKAQAGR